MPDCFIQHTSLQFEASLGNGPEVPELFRDISAETPYPYIRGLEELLVEAKPTTRRRKTTLSVAPPTLVQELTQECQGR